MDRIKIGSNRSFGIVFSVVFLLISIYPLINDENIRYWSLLISLIFLILGILNSRILTSLNIIWFKFGLFLGEFMSWWCFPLLAPPIDVTRLAGVVGIRIPAPEGVRGMCGTILA